MADDKIEKTEAAEAVAAEAEKSPKDVTFGTGEDALTLTIPRKWKRFKFMRALSRGDVAVAMEAVFGPDMAALLEEIEMTEDEFTEAMETIAKAIGGVTVGNS